jgi:trigger factor
MTIPFRPFHRALKKVDCHSRIRWRRGVRKPMSAAAKVESINTVQSRVTVKVPVEQVNRTFIKVAEKIQKKAKMDGFRPGKAPLALIRKAYKENIGYEVGDVLIRDTLHEALTAEGINPIAPPYVDSISVPNEGTEYEFSAVVDLMPAVQLDDSVKQMAVSFTEYQADEKSVERELLALAKRSAKKGSLPEDQEAQTHHWVTVSRFGVLDNQLLPHWDSKPFSLELGIDTLHPTELVVALHGMKAGDQKNLDVTLPADFEDASLAGKLVQFHINLHTVESLQIPTIDEEWAKDMEMPSLEALRKDLAEQIDTNVKKMTMDAIQAGVTQALEKKFTFEVPPTMVDRMIDQQIQDSRLSEKEKKTAVKDKELRKELRSGAISQIRLSLVLQELVKKENIQVTDDELQQHFQQKFASLLEKHPEEGEKVQKYLDAQKDRIRDQLMTGKLMDLLLQKATVTKTVQIV